MSELWSALEGGVVGLAVGTAGSDVAEAAFEAAKQEAWSRARNRIHELDELAQLVAQSLASLTDVQDDAARNGYALDELKAAVQLALRAPASSEALIMYRRRKLDGIDDATALEHLQHAFAKSQLEHKYWAQLVELADVPLEPAAIAEAIQRGIIPDSGNFLPVGPPTAPGKVKAFPPAKLDGLVEAAASGVSRERLYAMTALVGNPLGPHEAAQAVFRDIITLDDFGRAIAEGRTRNEWGDAYLELTRVIPTVHDYVEARLRGWIDDDGMYAGAARHGASSSDVDLLEKVSGRPLSAHEVFVAQRRGGVYDGPLDAIEPAYLKSLRESNIRPEWYNLAWAYRFAQPAPFLIRQWLKDGGDPVWAKTKLMYQGWEESDADKFVAEYAPKPSAKTPATLNSATLALLTAARSRYAAGKLSTAGAQSAMTAAAVPADEQPALLALWQAQLDVEAEASTPSGSGSAGGAA